MPLSLVSTPIGHAQDLTPRAAEILRLAALVIGEERREASTLLKRLGLSDKPIELLNEHSTADDVSLLVELCRHQNVALITDCGTPGFCDPGAKLVAACRAQAISVSPVPGASSLMCLLAVCGNEMREFVFRGFLPAEREQRKRALQALEGESRPVILMDTPYRLSRLLSELAEKWPDRRAVIGCDFTSENEVIVEGSLKKLAIQFQGKKAEFILAMFR